MKLEAKNTIAIFYHFLYSKSYYLKSVELFTVNKLHILNEPSSLKIARSQNRAHVE